MTDKSYIRHQSGFKREELEEGQDREMSFLDHLEILRWHIIRSLIVVLVIAIAAFLAKSIVFDLIIFGPTRLDFWTYRKLCALSANLHLGDNLCIREMGFVLSNIHMAGQFTQHIFVSFAVGIIMGFPYLTYELWRFLKPALRPSEKWYARALIFFSAILFFMGVLFGYFLLSPMSINFLGNYRVSSTVSNAITLSSYISTITSVTFATAIIFELPIVVFFLSKMGLITSTDMRHYRKHAIIIVLILSAVLTPPDLTSQLLLGIPFFILYEFSIFIAAVVGRRRG